VEGVSTPSGSVTTSVTVVGSVAVPLTRNVLVRVASSLAES
jgi:hypothetical protein